MKKILIIYEHVADHTDFFTMEFDEKDPQGQVDFEENSKELHLIHKQYMGMEINLDPDIHQHLDISGQIEAKHKIEEAVNSWNELIYRETGLPDWIKQISFGEVISCKPDLIFHSGIVS